MESIISRLGHWWAGGRTRQVTYENALKRARRGAAYLDEVDPGWHGRIDPAGLELSSGTSCVLGQLHGAFRRGLTRAQLFDLSSAPRASLSPVDYGFHCVQDAGEALAVQDYEYLNRVWQHLLRERHAAEASFRAPSHQPAEEEMVIA